MKKPKKLRKINGVTLGWGMTPQLSWTDGTIISTPHAERILYPRNWPEGAKWPVNPITGNRIEMEPSMRHNDLWWTVRMKKLIRLKLRKIKRWFI